MKYLIPEFLETERLTLRMFAQPDWMDVHQFYGDAECTRFTSGKAMTPAESWQKMASLLGHWQLRGWGSYALEEKTLGKVIGVAGLDYPADWPEPEIQWGLSKQFWGKKYASEAAREIKLMTAKYLPELSLISMIHPDNTNSGNLARSIGAVLERDYTLRGIRWHIYRH